MTAATGTTGRRVALLVVVVGAVLVTASLAGSFWPRVGGEPVPQQWSGEPLYLRADGPEAERCTVSPSSGPGRTVTVPGVPGRGLKLIGTSLKPWFDGDATINCPASVSATRGSILFIYPLAENDPWVIIPGVVLLAAGWVYLRRRHA